MHQPPTASQARRALQDNLEINGSTTGLNMDLSNVFLLGDTIEPDTVSLLLKRAGDIESNPGPGYCSDCGSPFSHLSRPVQCGECEGWFCKISKKGQKTTCSGLTRWKLDKLLKEGKQLVCRICKGETPTPHPPLQRGHYTG